MSRYHNTPNRMALQDALDRPLAVTHFRSRAATRKSQKLNTLRELAELIEWQKADSKEKAPWLKLATFGSEKSDKGSYRTNGNVKAVTGLEADYDGEQMTPEEGRDKLDKAGVAALIYTTPSHTPEAPRWRVLCPFSVDLPPEDREGHMARLNGVLGGVLDPASFTLSQAYYFGGVSGGAKVQTFLSEGRFLDRASDLDAGAIYRDGGKERPASVEYDGEKTGFDLVTIRDALLAIPNDHTNPKADSRDWWLTMLAALHHETDGSEEGLALALEWSALHPSFDADGTAAAWHSFRRGGSKVRTGATILAEAARNGWQDGSDFDDIAPFVEFSAEELAEIDALVGGSTDTVNPITGAQELSPLTFLNPTDCASLPARPYIVKGLLAAGDIAAVVGAPGAGKSLLAPRLAYAVAQGKPVFGKRVQQGDVFYVAAEDGHGMRARLSALRSDFGDADQLYLVSGVSDLLSKKGELCALQKAAKERRPKLIVIDTLAVAFPGLEENSAEGMGLVVKAARSLAQWGAAVVLIHHDTKAGDGLPRGHSLLNGALDVSIHLKREGGIVTGKPSKNRNGTTEDLLAFSIETRVIGEDEDGDAITTAICEETTVPMRPSGPKLTASASAALSVLRELGHGTQWVDEDTWRKTCVEGRTVSGSDDPDSRRKAFKRAVVDLGRLGKVAFSDGKFVERNQPGEDFTSDFDDV